MDIHTGISGIVNSLWSRLNYSTLNFVDVACIFNLHLWKWYWITMATIFGNILIPIAHANQLECIEIVSSSNNNNNNNENIHTIPIYSVYHFVFFSLPLKASNAGYV